jgi:hypothetical protein
LGPIGRKEDGGNRPTLVVEAETDEMLFGTQGGRRPRNRPTLAVEAETDEMLFGTWGADNLEIAPRWPWRLRLMRCHLGPTGKKVDRAQTT